MGSMIEVNDTLKISKARGFPRDLRIDDHVQNPGLSAANFLGKEFSFWNQGERLYHHPPTRVFFVEENEDKKWIYWGHALVIEQTIKEGRTEGMYRITRIYAPEYQRDMTCTESPQGKSFFEGIPMEAREIHL